MIHNVVLVKEIELATKGGWRHKWNRCGHANGTGLHEQVKQGTDLLIILVSIKAVHQRVTSCMFEQRRPQSIHVSAQVIQHRHFS